ncbi:DUF2989 domain-containing protein [Colwellia sp. D2M02]|uniref:DUF2989 domain-containing protein n=1 Tax=Colwellia sp. D2M02 TaxID=2841562 RepID=UPI001C0A495A|nr:DUF2989 domain-containing protein [Colwellia sp. D2M02]MBU2892553.1 DUF2989 domain-containing protein [Colwellia sp. D2M02]
MKLRFFIIFLPLTIAGCDNSPNLAQLCQENTEICNDFGKDNWCKVERNNVSLSRIALKNKPSADIEKFTLLLAYESYIKCMALASQIQHIKLKEKTTMRKNHLLKAKAHLVALTDETASSEHPHLLYYHWSRTANRTALEKFLALEGSPILENAIDQYHLATYYVKREPKKTLRLLYRSLELHQPQTELEVETLQTLATIFTNKKEYKQAYIWLKAYELAQETPDKWVVETLQQYQQAYQLDHEFLDEVAMNTLDNILAGSFTTPRY